MNAPRIDAIPMGFSEIKKSAAGLNAGIEYVMGKVLDWRLDSRLSMSEYVQIRSRQMKETIDGLTDLTHDIGKIEIAKGQESVLFAVLMKIRNSKMNGAQISQNEVHDLATQSGAYAFWNVNDGTNEYMLESAISHFEELTGEKVVRTQSNKE